MRFVFTAPRFHTNQRYAFKALLDAGHEVHVLVLRRGNSEAYDVLEPQVLGCSRAFDILRRLASVLPLLTWSDVGGLPPLLGFLRGMRRLRPDAVIVRNPSSAYGLLAMVSARLAGAQLVIYNQGPQHRKIGHARRVVETLFLQLTSAAWYTPVLGDPDRYAVLQHSPDYVPFVMLPQTSPDAKSWFLKDCVNLLHVGKLVPRKNHRMFLEAVARLLPRYPLRATIVGECSMPDHRREWERVVQLQTLLGLDEVVQVETNVPHLEMGKHYARHDLFVLASRDEPAAVSHLEAMAHSLPVVCSDANGTNCYVKHGENGYLFRSGDVDDLVSRIEGVIEDRDRLIEMGRRSYDLVRAEHTPRRYVDALVEMAGGGR